MSKIIENPEQLILSKAKEILYNEGYTRFSMRNLSAKCGIALGTIYNYYSTKEDLIIEMMTDYWKEHFYIFEDILNSDDTLYIKLNEIFNKLSIFIKTFKEVWLKPELYENPDCIKRSLEKQNIYIEKLVIMIEKILLKEAENNKIKLRLDSYEAAKFILMNYITMVQMPVFKYSSFERILKELL
ncbi:MULTISPECIES: TetR/AcrR family transcriptional regulator [Clostridium]|uniref:TetR/AcrR family transcriptional regulator n=1 Tax=Clostridium frigoriphilum TaxID=443253 RepID=A0ABU7UQM8_9CLOT|nr:TetR/AcrR family transcriptional regulator [Clostridium sp. DSM 17811]MBU3100595.1 TetR/AcrR family transcriptional regulator [Clostridium sp. DSM 17811]